ncbi:transmembrane protease serine 9-like [Drosophila rhopaloa]|uniref:Peptidase S1 domain-containing protein n=1 Tax=Drosophila rhopaloa TaxID=1041015 RepID=A0ABM5HCV3_DRORH|nr:transmembrane protease serine 9-like [Drosophila rhopaloa]
MRRQHRILPILFLLLAIYQVLGQDCWPSSEKRCVPHHKCQVGVQFRAFTTGNNGCPAPETCCQNIHILNDVLDINVEETVNPECGRPNIRGVSFEVPNMDGFAQEFEFPWMVALLDTRGNYLGGGAIISPELVITAKHVLDNLTEDQLIVRAGEWDLKTNSEQFPHVDAGIRSIVRHPGFNKNNGANNVALLFLRTPLKFTQHIKPICLPPDNRNFDYSRCIFSGWGKKSFNDYSYMNVLKKVELPIVRNNVCEYKLRQFYGNTFQLDNSLLCAGGELGKDSCKGDGGSPLACPLRENPQRYELAGIVNFGVECGMQDVPAVYTNVEKFRNWIIDETSKNVKGDEPEPESEPENIPPPFPSTNSNRNRPVQATDFGWVANEQQNTPPPIYSGVPASSNTNRSPGLAFPGQPTLTQNPRYPPSVPNRPPVQVADFGWVANEQQNTPPSIYSGVPASSNTNRSPGLAFPGQRTSPQYPRYPPSVPHSTRPPVQVADFGWNADEQQSTERNSRPPPRTSTQKPKYENGNGNTDDDFSAVFSTERSFDLELN